MQSKYSPSTVLAQYQWVLAHRCSNHPICRLPGEHWRKEDWNWRQQLGSRIWEEEDLGGAGCWGAGFWDRRMLGDQERGQEGARGLLNWLGRQFYGLPCVRKHIIVTGPKLCAVLRNIWSQNIPLLVDSHLNTLRTGLLRVFSIVVEATTKINNLLLHHLFCKVCSKQPWNIWIFCEPRTKKGNKFP